MELCLFLCEQDKAALKTDNDRLKLIIEQKNAEISHIKQQLHECNDIRSELHKSEVELSRFRQSIKERDAKFKAREDQIKRRDDQMVALGCLDCCQGLAGCCLIS